MNLPQDYATLFNNKIINKAYDEDQMYTERNDGKLTLLHFLLNSN